MYRQEHKIVIKNIEYHGNRVGGINYPHNSLSSIVFIIISPFVPVTLLWAFYDKHQELP